MHLRALAASAAIATPVIAGTVALSVPSASAARKSQINMCS